jgi:hypothetical protein
MRGRWWGTVREALVAAVIAFVVIAAVFMVTDMVERRMWFYTPGALAYALFVGTQSSPLITPKLVMSYTIVHVAVLFVFGFVAAVLAQLAERGAQLWYVALFLMLFVGFHLFAAVQALSLPAIASISQPMIWLAGVAASMAMSWYLLRSHPLIRRAQPW